MNLNKLLVTLFAACFAASGCGGATAPEQGADARPTATVKPLAGAPDDLAAARADYSQFCVRCHKPDGAGGAAEFDSDTLNVPSLREQGRRDSDERLAEQIRDGGGGMPPFKNRLDDKRINDLVRFIRSEFHGGDAAAPPAR
jgi:cytochrome c551